jgi:TorA maturation chaperone TorD
MKTKPIPESATTASQLCEARIQLYRWLSRALCDPTISGFDLILNPDIHTTMKRAADILRAAAACAPADMAPGEQPHTFLNPAGAMALCGATRSDRMTEYQRVFGLVTSKECPPYETEYCPQTFSVYRSQQMADVAGYYSAFGVAPSRDQPERPDHIVLELEFMAWLVGKEEYARTSDVPKAGEKAKICRDAQRRFLEEHLAWWAPAFAWALQKRADDLGPDAQPGARACSFYAAVGSVLAAFIPCERGILGVAAPTVLREPQADSVDPESECESCGLATPG